MMFIKISRRQKTALITMALGAFLITLFPAALRAQEQKRVKGLEDPDFVGKWDFRTTGEYGAWKPLQAAGAFESVDGVVHVTANSQRPCLNLNGPYAAADISAIEIRIRAIPVAKKNPAGSAASGQGDMGSRMRVLPQLYQGTRLYFTTDNKQKWDASRAIEFDLPHDSKYHVLTISPQQHEAWTGLIQKMRLDVGDFPNQYELDYIYFHRAPAGALSTESKK